MRFFDSDTRPQPHIVHVAVSLAWLALVAAGCKSPAPFPCADNSTCVHQGLQGICETDGNCSFPDETCESSRRYGESTAGGLENQCVAPTTSPCIAQLSFGAEHSCALKTDDTVWCWGSNGHSQIGNGAGDIAPSPTRIEGTPAGIVELTAGEDHTCVLTDGGEVWCWGSNESGQLGQSMGDPPVPAADTSVPVRVTGIPTATDVSGGGKHSCAVAGGEVYCWGSNGYAQLGDGTKTDSPVPLLIAGVSNAASVDAGDEHSCAVQTDGRAFCWGTNEDGQGGLGAGVDESLTPAQVTKMTGVEAIAVGDEHTCVQRGDETIWCWGYNGSGGVGNGSFDNIFDPVQVLIGPVVVTGAASFHTCGVIEENGNELWCWGANDDGQVGSGAIEKGVAAPQRVMLATVGEIIATGGTHTCAVTLDGQLWCWGNNEDGQLGTGAAGEPEFTPQRVAICP